MRQQAMGSLLTAAVIGILLGLYIHRDYVVWNQRGREAFISHQMHRFDLYMASPQATAVTILGALLLVLGLFALYEVIAFGFSAVLKTLVRDDGTS